MLGGGCMAIIRDTVQCNGQEIEVFIEVGDPVDTQTLLSRHDGAFPPDPLGAVQGGAHQVKNAFASARDLIGACASNVSEAVLKMTEKTRPSEWEVQIGIKFNSELNAILAKSQGEAQLEVTLRWQPGIMHGGAFCSAMMSPIVNPVTDPK